MDLDKEYNPEPDLMLATILNEWLGKEQLRAFRIDYPRRDDTIAAGLEGWISYNHHPEGYAGVATIYNQSVYMEYESATIEASNPDFFADLKAALRRFEARHAKCSHLRSFND